MFTRFTALTDELHYLPSAQAALRLIVQPFTAVRSAASLGPFGFAPVCGALSHAQSVLNR